jgi:sacsin
MTESTSSNTKVAIEFLHDLRHISLWPTANVNSDTLLSSNNALVAENDELVVPWIDNFDRFVAPNRVEIWDECMKFLKVVQIGTTALIRCILPLPSSVSTSNWGRYEPLIATIAKHCDLQSNWEQLRTLLQKHNIAVDGNRTVTHARNLYDHQDQVFVAAFRGEEQTKFLNPTVDKYKPFWRKAGLRHRKNGYFASGDFLECLTSIAARLLLPWEAAFESDFSVVLGPLTSPSSCTDGFNSEDWKAVSAKTVFRSIRTFDSQPRFRRSLMTSVATNHQVLSLSEVVAANYTAVCWSQTAFPVHMPTKEVFHKIGTAGKPPASMVWRHLVHLHSLRCSLDSTTIQGFLSDLHATYAYLQDNLVDACSIATFRGLPLFLNTASMDGRGISLAEIQSSWVDIKHLVLSSSCDAGLVQAVRPGLKQYEKLLTKLGCKAIVYPVGNRMNPPSQQGISSGHRGIKGLHKMRDKQEGCDVAFRTEGREIKAHRLILASVSENWHRQFFELHPVEPIFIFDPANKEKFLTYDALLTVVQYAYHEPIDEDKLRIEEGDAEDIKVKKLKILLDLHKAANFQLIETLAEYVQYMIMVAIEMVINIDNVEEIQEKAKLAGADKAEEYCVSFHKANKETLGYKNE